MTALANETWAVEPGRYDQTVIVARCEHVDGEQITVRHNVYVDTVASPERVTQMLLAMRCTLVETVSRVTRALQELAHA